MKKKRYDRTRTIANDETRQITLYVSTIHEDDLKEMEE